MVYLYDVFHRNFLCAIRITAAISVLLNRNADATKTIPPIITAVQRNNDRSTKEPSLLHGMIQLTIPIDAAMMSDDTTVFENDR